MIKIVDLIIVIFILIASILLNRTFPNAVGGSTVFVLLVPALFYFSYVEKRAQYNVSLISFLLLLVLATNYLHYLDLNRMYSQIWISVVFCILNVLSLSIIAVILLKPLNYTKDIDQVKFITATRQNFKFISFNYLLFSLFYAVITCLVFVLMQRTVGPTKSFLTLIPASFFWITLGLLLLRFSLKIMKEEQLVKAFMNDEKEIDYNYKKHIKLAYYCIMLTILVVGSAIEIARKEWILWIESFVFINIVVLLFWKIYCFRTISDKSNIPRNSKFIKTFMNPKSYIMIVGLNSVFITVVIVSLILLLYYGI